MASARSVPSVVLAAVVWLTAMLATQGTGAAPGAARSSPRASSSAPDASSEPAASVSDEPPSQRYKRHLDSGVRLWQEKDYRAAIAEFEAAYRAEPKASPLVNIALCRKALLEYPEAVEALDRALGEHADQLDPTVREAAEREATELRALIGYVTVKSDPPGASLFIDGVERGRANAGRPIALSPGPREIEARMDGYAPATAKIEVAAGQHRREVVLELAPSVGRVRVVPRDSGAFVQVDEQSPVQAGWEGTLPPGEHQIRVFSTDGSSSSVAIRVRAGEQVVVTQQKDGSLTSPAALRADTPEPAPADEPPRTGFFLHGNGALLFIGGTPPEGIAAKSGGGAALGLRIGYRLADWAALEAGGQLSSVAGTGELRVADHQLTAFDGELGYASYPEARYTLRTIRLGAMLRLLVPGRSVVRFVAAAGGGLLGEELDWDPSSANASPDPSADRAAAEPIHTMPSSASGWNGYGQIDLGVELEFSNVFFGLSVQHILQGTQGLTGEAANDTIYVPYPGPIFLLGPALHVGYGFW